MSTDKERLDFLQEMLEKKLYTGKVIFRWSSTGRGWRLHETNHYGSVDNVREAIDQAIRAYKEGTGENE